MYLYAEQLQQAIADYSDDQVLEAIGPRLHSIMRSRVIRLSDWDAECLRAAIEQDDGRRAIDLLKPHVERLDA